MPAKKRINPWSVGRYVGLGVLALLPVLLTGWAWWHIFTADMRPFNAPNFIAAVVAFLSGITTLVGICIGCSVLADRWDDIADWWAEREAKWDEVEDR